MKWVRIRKQEVDSWNEKLKNTNASFFQYPYYAAGYTFFFMSRAIYLKLIDNKNNELGFCCILEIGASMMKFGLVIRGPVLFENNNDFHTSISVLKQFAKKERYAFLRVNANDSKVDEFIQSDVEFEQKDYFPAYKGSQDRDLNIYYKPFDQLLKGFRTDCRNKIRYVGEKNYLYETIKTPKELKTVYNLFIGLGEKKQFSYRPLKSYGKIFTEGIKYGLCSVYTAFLDGRIVCAAFIVKDGHSATYFSGALELKDIPAKYSPANNLHYLVMQDAFYKEGKSVYNLSYSAPGSGVHMFKTSFKPEETCKPSFYTYIIKRKTAERILSWQGNSLSRIRKKLRNIIKLFNK